MEKDNILEEPIELLNLDPKTFFILKQYPYKINTISDLINTDYSKIKGIGPKQKEIINLTIANYIRR